MAAAAERLADQVIVTDDNPRTEDGDAIVADIVKGFAAPARALIERDRAAAIAQGIALGKPGDVVLIAGKGHEDYQIVGAERRHFSDREVARAVLEQTPMMAWRLSEVVRYARRADRGQRLRVQQRLHRFAHAQAGRVVRRAERSRASTATTSSPRRRSAARPPRSSSDRLPSQIPQLVTPDPLGALSAFAREWRRQFHIPLVGVTGSNGKTTTKELIGSILSRQGKTLITRGNLNNHIGVPLMLLELTAEHRYAVIEMGANHIGEIAHLASLAEPTVGIVTNAGAAHLEGFGSLAGVAQGKGEMFRALPAEGVAVINADDTFAAQWRDSSAAERVLTFGFEQPADFMAHKVRVAERRRWIPHRLRSRHAVRQQARDAGARRPAQPAQCIGRGGSRMRRRRRARRDRRRPRGNEERRRPARAQARAERRVPRRRLVQRQSQLAAARASMRSALSAACAGWCSAKCASSATAPTSCMPKSAATRSRPASRGCSRSASARASRWKHSVRARSGSRAWTR